MRVIVLTDHFGGGGAERVASILINGLSADPYNDVHVCVFKDVNTYGVAKNRISYHLIVEKEYCGILDNIMKIWSLIKTIKKVKPDVIYSFGPIMASYVIIASFMGGMREKIRIVSSERNDPRREPDTSLKKHIRNICYTHSDVLVCQTPLAVDILKKYGVNTKFVIIPNPITPNLPSWKGQNSKDIITAARLTEQKNLPLMIKAFKRIHNDYPEFRLVIYGEGVLRVMLKKIIEEEELSDCILIPGFAKNIHYVMSQAYMYVSSSDYEGISNSMLEALAIGLPCVCTDCPVGGAAMYIQNEKSGILTKVGNEIDLYEGMKKLIEHKGLAIMISTASKEAVKNLTMSNITKEWLKLSKS